MSDALTRPETMLSYCVTACRTLSIRRLYSCRRLTITSSMWPSLTSKPSAFAQHLAQAALVGGPDLGERSAELRVLRRASSGAAPSEVGHPARAEGVGDERRQRRVREADRPRGHAVRHVFVNLPGKQLIEVRQHLVAQRLRVASSATPFTLAPATVARHAIRSERRTGCSPMIAHMSRMRISSSPKRSRTWHPGSRR